MFKPGAAVRLAVLAAVAAAGGGPCALPCSAWPDAGGGTTFRVVIERGEDVGQCFGSLFEVESEDGAVVMGAGFPNVYNTRNRADRHQLQFFARPTDGERAFEVEALPRPNHLCGTYLHGRDGIVYSTVGGLKAWDPSSRTWRDRPGVGGTEETMRVGDGLLEFGDSVARYDGRTILAPPDRGTYQLFFYANGTLCFYQVDRGDGPYRPFKDSADGFSKLHACRWKPGDPPIDLSRNDVARTLPIVGETTFAWGVLGGKIVTGSNIGGFYALDGDGDEWRIERAPDLKASYQLYSTSAFFGRLLMGQYPTGRLFEYDGRTIADRPGWPPAPAGASTAAREAQTTVVYGGELLVGVWPWGELWRLNPSTEKWSFIQRMFSHPEVSDKTIHPYDAENRADSVSNRWGQRVTSLVPSGADLFVSTSAKSPGEWDPERYPFLAPDGWKSYGSVYRLTTPGSLAAEIAWTNGPTVLELTVRGTTMTIAQDGGRLARATLDGPLADRLRRSSKLKAVSWRSGIHGPFGGRSLDGSVSTAARP